MTKYKGIPIHFTMQASFDIQPGEVPGPGGLFDVWTCDRCGWKIHHQVFGGFWMGEKERMDRQFEDDLMFHERHCKPFRACCMCAVTSSEVNYFPETGYSHAGWYCPKCRPGPMI